MNNRWKKPCVLGFIIANAIICRWLVTHIHSNRSLLRLNVLFFLIIGFSVVVLHGTKGWMKGKYSMLNGLFTPVQRQNIAHGGHTRVREYELFTHKYLSRSGWLRVTKSNSLSHPSSASLTSFLLASMKILTWFIVLSVSLTDKLLFYSFDYSLRIITVFFIK